MIMCYTGITIINIVIITIICIISIIVIIIVIIVAMIIVINSIIIIIIIIIIIPDIFLNLHGSWVGALRSERESGKAARTYPAEGDTVLGI